MTNSKRYIGAKIRGLQERQEAIRKYYEKPNYCVYCNAIIDVKDNKKVSDVRKQKFCNKSCLAYYKNRKYENKKCTANISGKCVKCETIIFFKPRKTRGYFVRKYCDSCLALSQARNITNNLDAGSEILLVNQTKNSLYSRRKNWQSANTAIRKNAREIFFKSDRDKICEICGYSNYIEVCHIKPVKDFDVEEKIIVINSLDNLVPLCPNHHWEFDHGLINIS